LPWCLSLHRRFDTLIRRENPGRALRPGRPGPPATSPADRNGDLGDGVAAPAQVPLDLEASPVGGRRPEEGRAALAKERELPSAPGTRNRRTGSAGLIEPDGWAHSITSSARASTEGGIVRPRALAVLRLMTSSNFVGCSTGKSAGLAPFRILST